MSHPPIPPKSKMFQGGAFESFDEYGDCIFSVQLDWSIHQVSEGLNRVNTAELARWRPVIAAVAEVEWRKRAERWESLALHYYNDFAPCVREQFFWDMHSISRRNADAWRAWAEEKSR